MKAGGLLSLLFAPLAAVLAVPSLLETVADGVTVVRDDTGNWGGMTNGITHMNRGGCTARKILDTSDVPAAVWQAGHGSTRQRFRRRRDLNPGSARKRLRTNGT